MEECELRELKEENRKLRENLENLLRERESVKQKVKIRIEELVRRAEAAESHNSELRQLITELNEKIETLISERNSLLLRIAQLTGAETSTEGSGELENLLAGSEYEPSRGDEDDVKPRAHTSTISKVRQVLGDEKSADGLRHQRELLEKKANLEREGLELAVVANRLEVKGGTVEKLVEMLYRSHEGLRESVPEYINIFLLTYRSFMPPRELLTRLHGTYVQLSDAGLTAPGTPGAAGGADGPATPAEEAKAYRIRICSFMKNWMEKHFHDFEGDEELVGLYREFAEAVRPVDGEQLSQQLRRALERQSSLRKDTRNYVFPSEPPAPIVPPSECFGLLDIDPLELARQLTLRESHLYRQVQAKEFLNLAWTKKDKEQRAPRLLAFIHWFNHVSLSVRTAILELPAPDKRAAMVRYWIAVADHLHRLNNFNGLMEVLSALHSNPIHRLRKTWDALPKKARKLFDELQDLMSTEGSAKKYRMALRSANPPLIPYLGRFLSDLVFVDENPDVLKNGYINFFKRRKMAEIIQVVQQYQTLPYNLSSVDVLQEFLLKMRAWSDEECHRVSLELEPRDPAHN